MGLKILRFSQNDKLNDTRIKAIVLLGRSRLTNLLHTQKMCISKCRGMASRLPNQPHIANSRQQAPKDLKK